MYCSGCEGTVNITTKICPHCGGDFSQMLGPVRRWGKPSKPKTELKPSREEQIDANAETRTQELLQNSTLPSPSKVMLWVLGFAAIYYIVVPVISWLFF